MTGSQQYIPFNKPCLEGLEVNNMLQAVHIGKLAGDGHFGKACEALIADSIGAKRVLLTNSGTAALELSALLCDIRPGDELIMPSFTFVSTANAFCLRNATPVFVDISRRDLNIDPDLIEAAITDRTRAIVPVHYAGASCDMDRINDIAARYDLDVIEDAAHGYLATYKGQYLGTMSRMGCFSFHETKTFICGEGGAIVLNREEDISAAEIIREKGTNRARFFRGEIDKYTWVGLGSSYLASELVAAFLYGQLLARETIISKRRVIFQRYERMLSPLAQLGLIESPIIREDCETAYHMCCVLVKDLKTRTKLLDFLKKAGVCAVFHYVPLHLSPYAASLGLNRRLPVTEEVSDRLIRLPFYNSLNEKEQNYVIENVFKFFKVKFSEKMCERVVDNSTVETCEPDDEYSFELS